MLSFMENADNKTALETLLLAVSLCDSQADFARRIGRSTQAVWTWVNRDKKVPVEACPFVENAFKDPRITCERLRPDYRGFEILRESSVRTGSHREVA